MQPQFKEFIYDNTVLIDTVKHLLSFDNTVISFINAINKSF